MRLLNEQPHGIACVYEIRSDVGQKVYVGSTNRSRHRFREHRRRLRLGTHHSRHLQNAFNRHGEQSFFMRVVKTVEETELLAEEQRLADFYGKPLLYNSTTLIERGGFDPKPIVSIDPSTGEKTEFSSARDAASLLGLNEHAAKNIRNGANRGRLSFGRFWSHDQSATIETIRQHKKAVDERRFLSKPDKVFSFFLSGTLHGRYKSIWHAAKVTGIKRELIAAALKSEKYRTAGGMTWNNASTPKAVESKKTKAVFRIDKAGQLTWFDSIIEAASQTASANSSGISNVVNGRKRTHAGYRWAFAKT